MRHEVEVDTKLAELWQAEQAARAKVGAGLLYLHHALDEKVKGASWGYKYADPRQFLSTDEVIEARARELDAADEVRLTHRGAVRSTLRSLDELRLRLAEIRAEAAPLEADFKANRWSRFFLVLNRNGHVHSSMHCSTCRVSTSFGWQPELSGLDEAAAVEALGPKLCSVCYPSAPVEWIGKGRGA